jgi:hypothetical protein
MNRRDNRALKPNPEETMKSIARLLIAGALLLAPAAASAYSLSGDGCGGNGNECVVYCSTGARAGSMYYNGSVWTDGTKSATTRDAEAKKICAANGSGCT